jgi:hypothetical protein
MAGWIAMGRRSNQMPGEHMNEAGIRPPMPIIVKIALSLYIVGVAVGILRGLVMPLPDEIYDVPGGADLMPWIIGVTVVIQLILIALVATGRWWAFIVLLVLFLIGLPTDISFAREFFHLDRPLFLIVVGHMLLFMAAYALLLSGEARAWFRAAKQARQAPV